MVTTAQLEARRTTRAVTLTAAVGLLATSIVCLGLVPIVLMLDPAARGHSTIAVWTGAALLLVALVSWLLSVALLVIGLASGTMHRGWAGVALAVAVLEAIVVVWIGASILP